MTSTTKFDAMGKEALRTACRAAGISYGKLNNDGMRAALADAEKLEPAAEISAVPDADEVVEQAEEFAPAGPNPFAALFGAVAIPDFKGTVTKSSDGKVVDGMVEAPKAAPRSKIEKTPAPFVPPVIRKGYKIQKEREVSNGVKRPSGGTVCEKIWAYLDANKNTASFNLDTIADAALWDRTTVRCQFYTWRKFNGIHGRQTV